MLTLIISSILLISLLSLTNAIRGGRLLNNFLPFIGQRHKAMILFGVSISTYALINGYTSLHIIDFLMYKGFDILLMFASALGFLVWAMLGWGDYMDMGRWQKHSPDGVEVKFIDAILNFAAKLFPNVFIERVKWIPEKWNTFHTRTDLLGMTLRCFIMAIPIFGFYAWYFSNINILFLSFILGLCGPIYYFWSKSKSVKNYIGTSEWYAGALCWGTSIVLMFLLT